MVQQTWTNISIPATGGFLPSATGFNDAIFANATSASASATLRNPDLNDATLSIDIAIEITNDASGATGWSILDGLTWNGGPQGRDHTAKQPSIGPYSTTNWPPFQRLRMHATPSRSLTGVTVTASITQVTNVAFDAATDGGAFVSASSRTFSHTVGSLTNGCLDVGVSFWTNGTTVTISGVTYNAVAMTRIVQSARSPNDDRAEIWRLVNPASGAHNVVVTFAGGSTDGEAGAASLQFVDQTTPERATNSAVSATTTSTTATLNISGAQAGDAAVDTVTWDLASTTATMVSHSPRTQRWNDSGGTNEGGAGSTMLGPANPQTLDWTFSAGRAWALAAVVHANDGGGGGGGGLPLFLQGDLMVGGMQAKAGGFQ